MLDTIRFILLRTNRFIERKHAFVVYSGDSGVFNGAPGPLRQILRGSEVIVIELASNGAEYKGFRPGASMEKPRPKNERCQVYRAVRKRPGNDHQMELPGSGRNIVLKTGGQSRGVL